MKFVQTIVLMMLLTLPLAPAGAEGPTTAPADANAAATVDANAAAPKEEVHLFAVKVNGKYGFINNKGEIIIQPTFDDAACFAEGLASVSVGGTPAKRNIRGTLFKYDATIGGKWGVIDQEGQIVVPLHFEWVSMFHDGYASVNAGAKGMSKNGFPLGGKWGAIDRDGNMIIKPQFNLQLYFNDGLSAVNIGGRQDETGRIIDGLWGYVDTHGKMAIEPRFTHVYPFKEGFAAVAVGGTWVGVHDDADEQNEPSYSLEGAKYGLIDANGDFVVEPSYEHMFGPSEGLVAVKVKGKWGYIDYSGKMVIRPRFIWASIFNEGLAGVCIKKRSGHQFSFIGKAGKVKFHVPEGMRAIYFKEGLARLEEWTTEDEIKTGFIDKTGKIVIPLKDWYAASFRNGLSWVIVGGKPGYIDKTGEYVWPPSE